MRYSEVNGPVQELVARPKELHKSVVKAISYFVLTKFNVTMNPTGGRPCLMGRKPWSTELYWNQYIDQESLQFSIIFAITAILIWRSRRRLQGWFFYFRVRYGKGDCQRLGQLA
jgi:hypothetical protein